MAKNVDRKAAVQKLRNLVLTPKSDLDGFRTKIEQTYNSVFLPNHVELNERNYGGVKCDFLVPECYSSRRIIIYVHGGSFVGGSRDSWRNFCASFANAASCRVVVPEFRLAPSFPFPASIEDVMNVFRLVYSEEEVALQLEQSNFDYGKRSSANKDNGTSHAQIILAADGSGASIAIGALMNLPEKYRMIVKSLILLSPWLDLTSDCELIKDKRCHDEVIGGEDLHRAVDLYTYALNIPNPLVSPLKAPAEKFINFPPIYIQMGEKEILLRQVKQFKELVESVGVSVTLDLWKNMMYMFQMADEYLPESHLAIEKLGQYISKPTGLTEEEKAERDAILRLNDIAIER